MIKIIAGEKGTGKTAKLVEDINTVAAADNNVVCIERGNRLDQLLKPNVRLVNMEDYPVEGLEQLLAFVCGICSKDYDLTHIYIDSIYKVANGGCAECLEKFIAGLNKFIGDDVTVSIILSGSPADLPESVKQYC